MIDPYRMVFVNVIASCLVLLGIIAYKFVYPKKKINLFTLLLFISILPIISIFRAGDYESGDFNIHIYRTMAFYESLKEGNVMPSWAKDLNATYGYPLFIFNYSLPYYILSFFHLLGFSFVMSMKIFLALNFVFSGIFMYLYAREVFKNNLAALTSAIFYNFTPYHLIDIHFKVAIGEIAVFTLLPLVFLFLHKLYRKRLLTYALWASVWLAFVIMSNALLAFFVAGASLAYITLFTLKRKFDRIYFLYSIFIFIVAAILSLYIWVAPFLFNSSLYIHKSNLMVGYFPQLWELLYSPYRLGLLFQGPIGQIPFLIGYTQLFVLVSTLVLLILKRTITKHLKDQSFWLIISFVIIFLITPYSKFLWEHFSFVKAAGSHRLLLLLTFCISILAGFLSLLSVKRKILVYLLIIVTIGYTILNWGHRRVIPEINDNILKANLWKSTSQGEGHFYANSKWVDIKNPWFSKLPKSHLEVVSGTGETKDISRTSTNHKYMVTAKTILKIQENTLYFPGWKGHIDRKAILLYPSSKGIIQASIPQGNYRLEITYQDIFIYKLLKTISALSFIGASIFIILKFLYSYLH